MPRGLYTVVMTKTTIANASGDYDLFEITPADDKPVEIVGLYLGQKTELGDAQEEQIRWALMRGHATSGSGGAAPTPQKTDSSDPAASFTAETNNSTIASAGTNVTLHEDTYNLRAGLPFIWPPDMRCKCSQADGLIVVRMLEAVTDDVDMTGTLYVLEA